MNEKQRRSIYKLALPLTTAAGLFILLFSGLLAFNEVRGKVATLVNSKQVVRLHDELRSRPKDEALKAQIRKLDLKLRKETFYRLQLSHDTARILLAGLVVFLASAHFVRTSRRRLPDLQAWGARKAAEEKRTMTHARYAVACIIVMVSVTAVALSTEPVKLPEASPASPSVATVSAFPSADEMQLQWPSFRGPNGSGIAPKATVPVTWNGKSGTNIRWKTAVPLSGSSSPVVWDKAVFVTGADETQSSVFRFDADSGALLWSATIKLPGGARPPKPQVNTETSLAAPTPATDGRRVYALFPTGEIAAFDFSGKQIWARNIGPLENSYGYAASLAICQDRLLIQIDCGQPEDGKSKMLALNTQTGQPLWETKRDVAGSWSSPIVANIDGKPQLITCANPFVIAYNPVDGRELWRNKCLDSDVAPSPIVSGNMVVATAPNNNIVGLHPGAKDLSWKVEEDVPDATSPVSDGQRLYIISGAGMLTCYGLQGGKSVWTHQLDGTFYASPTIAGNALILVNQKGASWVIETGNAYKELGKGELGEECFASPVPLGKRIFLRGKENLFCIESK
ncbi:MAG: PQQ-binding-like beta-propeller repeat protein [Methylacidiphilales bacterium]|nr:PQQ-binding-like beta-propeller repeat protein [Candidatus Methylacidiphilales bacterium]